MTSNKEHVRNTSTESSINEPSITWSERTSLIRKDYAVLKVLEKYILHQKHRLKKELRGESKCVANSPSWATRNKWCAKKQGFLRLEILLCTITNGIKGVKSWRCKWQSSGILYQRNATTFIIQIPKQVRFQDSKNHTVWSNNLSILAKFLETSGHTEDREKSLKEHICPLDQKHCVKRKKDTEPYWNTCVLHDIGKKEVDQWRCSLQNIKIPHQWRANILPFL